MNISRLKYKKNNSGFSIVELICAIAILSLVTLSVGRIFVICSRAFTREVSQIDVQQDSQFVSSIINDLIMDCKDAPVWRESSPGSGVYGYQIDKGSDTYFLYLDTATHELNVQYGSTTEPIAHGVSSFSLIYDESNFAENKKVNISLALLDGTGNYKTQYDITARNGDAAATISAGVATINTNSKIYVEPSQNYSLSLSVSGLDPSISSEVDITLVGRTDSDTHVIGSRNNFVLKVGRNEYADALSLVIETKYKPDGINPAGRAFVTAYVRRVEGIKVSCPNVNGENLKTGTVYEIKAETNGKNFPQGDTENGVEDGLRYYDPKQVSWEVKSYGGASYEVLEPKDGSMSEDPTIKIKLTNELTANQFIQIFAEAAHPSGQFKNAAGVTVQSNKTNSQYVDTKIKDRYDIIGSYFGFDSSKLYRGSDDAQGFIYLHEALKAELKDIYGHDNFKARVFYRFKEINSSVWNGWYDNPGDANDSIAINLRPTATLQFDPCKKYNIEVKVEMYDDNLPSKPKVWPYSDTPEAQWLITDVIDYASVTCKLTKQDGGLIFDEAITNNIVPNLENGQVYEMTPATVKGIKPDLVLNNMKYVIQKWNGSGWDDYFTNNQKVGKLTIRVNKGGDNPAGTEAHINSSGQYRVLVEGTSIKYSSYNPSTKTYTCDDSHTHEVKFWREGDNVDIFYFNVE